MQYKPGIPAFSCLWYLMEPLITKNESYSYSFYKKMIENIKQTKDAQNPDNQEANMVSQSIVEHSNIIY